MSGCGSLAHDVLHMQFDQSNPAGHVTHPHLLCCESCSGSAMAAVEILKAFRNIAAGSQGYDSTVTNLELVEKFKLASPGKEPYPWQIDVSEALILGLDCLIIAGTGAGKNNALCHAPFG